MIFLPVNPESALGPPRKKLPLGFKSSLVFLSNHLYGIAYLMTFYSKSALICEFVVYCACCADIKIV